MPLHDELLEPIAGENPAGEYLRYDPIYDKIKEARREDLDIPQGEWQTTLKTADWPLVIKLSSDLLATRSKDLQVAAWLTEALLKRDGFGGLREGLELMAGLIENFWDVLHPELEDGDAEFRAAPLEWVAKYFDASIRSTALTEGGYNLIDYQTSRSIGYEEDAEYDDGKREAREKAIAEGKPTGEDFDKDFNATPKSWYKGLVADLDSCLATLERLDQLSDERFQDVAPNFVNLRQALQEVRQVARVLLDKKLVAEPDPVEAQAATPAAADVTAPSAAASHAGAAMPAAPSAQRSAGVPAISISPMPGSGGEAAGRISAAARFLRAESPGNPAPYLLLRGYRWGEIRAGGGEVDPQLLEAPPTEVRSQLKRLLLDEKWKELLEAGEEVMAAPYGRGWLDLQRYSVTACDALGSEFDALGAALRSAVRSLLNDLPQLPTLALMDDSPTANAETRRWLEDERLIDQGTPAPTEERRPVQRRDPLERALERVRTGDPHGGVELLMREAAKEQSPRDRFLRRLQAAGILVDTGLETVAMPMLQQMAEQIDEYKLEQWETNETVAQPLGLLYRCMCKVDGESSDSQALFLRVSRLDPLLAIHLTSGSTNGSAGE